MRRQSLLFALLAILAIAGAGVAALVIRSNSESGGEGDPTPTTIDDRSLPVAPLTGLEVPQDRAALLDRPALAVKVDNHPAALPQSGLELADVVIEVEVESISRFIAVFHSSEVERIGPVRSARTGDPDVLAMFGRPLFAWSGANPTTTELVQAVPWIQNIDSSVDPGVYSRDPDRRAPHNLVLDGPAAFEAADQPPVVPTPIFEWREPSSPEAGEPAVGFDLSIGSTDLAYRWEPESSGWRRSSYGTVHDDASGEPLIATNVVVLETVYEQSVADVTSPEAQSLGTGRAWAFTDGRAVEGTWVRARREEPWRLISADGQPMLLERGRTHVALAPEGSAPILVPLEAQQP